MEKIKNIENSVFLKSSKNEEANDHEKENSFKESLKDQLFKRSTLKEPLG